MEPEVPLEKLRAQLARYVLSLNDFEEALSYLYARPAEDATVIRRALLTSAIVAYARPFTQNETESSAASTSTVALKLSKLLTAEQLILHTAIIEMRHKAIAHSTSQFRPVHHQAFGPAAYSAGHLVFDPLKEPIDRPLFAATCEALHAACQSALLHLNAKLAQAGGAA